MLDLKRLVSICAERYEASSRDARRLLHGRGHTFPGFEQVTVDSFAPYLLVGLFRHSSGGPVPLMFRFGTSTMSLCTMSFWYAD